ncbi:MAG: DUF3833 domain-containing protein [Desulfobulbales bacterium]|nr:DUF3833 domain-containing protein [Desulfobulbales bacterium]
MKHIWHFSELFLLVVFLLLSGGCSSVKVSDYSAMQPIMKPENFFNGPITAHGVIKNRSGRVTSYFNAEITGSWKNGTGTLAEDFIFSDGEKSRRVWTFRKNSDGTYTGTAADVVGKAHGQVSGNSMFLKYVLRIPYGDKSIDVTIDDRMYQTTGSILINESIMYKFGFRVGEILLVMVKKIER